MVDSSSKNRCTESKASVIVHKLRIVGFEYWQNKNTLRTIGPIGINLCSTQKQTDVDRGRLALRTHIAAKFVPAYKNQDCLNLDHETLYTASRKMSLLQS